MTDSRWEDVGELFEEALEVAPRERAAFLRARCDDEAVRQEVASLLSAHDEATGFFEGLAEAVIPSVQGELEQTWAHRAAASDPLELEGRQVGRYAVEAYLGGGGMGVVYRARDTRLGRRVALKFLPPFLTASAEAGERFVREARAASALDHPHLATVYEIDTVQEIGEVEPPPEGGSGAGPPAGLEGRRYIAMAYYAGETLAAKIARGPLPVEEALGYARQIAEGLGRAHEAGIVHRDVKPANVMVTERGQVKLVDFGLARVAGQPQLTRTGRPMGTAAYMSPEQARGEAVDHRTDLWALGVVLYEMLTGERPFTGARETQVLYAILHEEPVPVGRHRAEAPARVGAILERCLQKDPVRRYQSAQALLDDLQARGSGTALASARSPSRPGGRRWLSRFGRFATGSSARGGAGAVMALVLIASLVWWWAAGASDPYGEVGGVSPIAPWPYCRSPISVPKTAPTTSVSASRKRSSRGSLR